MAEIFSPFHSVHLNCTSDLPVIDLVSHLCLIVKIKRQVYFTPGAFNSYSAMNFLEPKNSSKSQKYSESTYSVKKCHLNLSMMNYHECKLHFCLKVRFAGCTSFARNVSGSFNSVTRWLDYFSVFVHLKQ